VSSIPYTAPNETVRTLIFENDFPVLTPKPFLGKSGRISLLSVSSWGTLDEYGTQKRPGTRMAYQTADAKRQFDRWSYWYDWDPLQLVFFRPAHQMLLNALDAADERILDIGCGTGAFAARLLERWPAAHVWGVDLSHGMLRTCVERRTELRDHLHLVQANSERLPFKDNAFDAVTCTHSFHHYPRQALAVAEMQRVLRPSGKLLIIDGDPGGWWGGFVFDILVVSFEGPVHHLTARDWVDLFCRSGFDNVVQHRRGGPLPFLLTCGQAVKTTRTIPSRRAA
jgi:ubiquinone/menaquinone biosynthesis C-methylase UbiE